MESKNVYHWEILISKEPANTSSEAVTTQGGLKINTSTFPKIFGIRPSTCEVENSFT